MVEDKPAQITLPTLSSSSTQETTFDPKPSPPNNIAPHVLQAIKDEGLAIDRSGSITFAPSSPAHPRRWPLRRKIYDTSIICLLEFLTTVISNSGSDVASSAALELGLSREITLFYFTTLYLLGQGFGGLLLPPICEAFGGKFIYVGSAAGFTAMCLMTGLAPSVATVVVGRLISGALSAMPTVVATGSIENMWDSRGRVLAIDVWAIAGFLGMAVGPVYATYVSESDMGWYVRFIRPSHECMLTVHGRHWVFYGASISVGVATVLAFGIKESRPVQLLRRKAKVVSRKTQTEKLPLQQDASVPSSGEFFRTTLYLPVSVFFTEPIICLSSIMGAAVVRLVLSTCVESRHVR